MTIRPQNLKRFAFRQWKESDDMKAKIYDRLRERYGIVFASSATLRNIAEENNDAYGVALCDFAEALYHAQTFMLQAERAVKQ